MKKIISMLLSLLFVASICVPAFAAEKYDTVTISLDNIEDIMPEPEGVDHVINLLNLQAQYLTYCNDVLVRSSNSGQTDSNAQTQTAAQKKLELGYISQKEYDDLVQSNNDTTVSQQTQTNQRAADLLKLRHMLELDDADKLVIKSADYSEIDLSAKLSNVRYDKDLENLDLADLSAGDSSDTELTGKVESFKALYNTLMQADHAYELDSGNYETKKTQAQLMQQKFANGYATQKQVNDINLELQTLGNTVAKEKNSLYIAYLRYDYMRDNGESPDSISLY